MLSNTLSRAAGEKDLRHKVVLSQRCSERSLKPLFC